MAPLTNWAGNVKFRAAHVQRPASVAELQRLVTRTARIRAVGTAHSFSRIADTTGDLVSAENLPTRIQIDAAGSSVTVSAGLRYSDVAPRLNAAGLALANLASLPHISIAGAVATGTHGSGDANAGLAAAVSALELVIGTGETITVRRDTDPGRFPGLVVALGACGVVTSLTLDVVPAFTVRQWVHEEVPFAEIAARFDEVTAAAYSVSVFTSWDDRRLAQVWLKCKDPARPPADGWLGGQLARAARHPVPGMPAATTTPQLGVPGPWHERLPHFRPEFTPSAGAELQSEFLVARTDAAAALAALDAIRAELSPVLLISEIRTMAPDELWLSPAYQRPSVGLHFTWIPDADAVAPVLASVERALAPLHPRPHWGKLASLAPDIVSAAYPRMDDFRRLARELDPHGKFRNDFTDTYLRPTPCVS
jgi:xylitol oxidase